MMGKSDAYKSRHRECFEYSTKPLMIGDPSRPGDHAQETLEQLAARLPRVRGRVKALEFGEFRFFNGMSLLAYIGGIERRDGIDCIHYSQTTTLFRRSVYPGHNNFRFGQEDVIEFGSGRIQVHDDPPVGDIPRDPMDQRPRYTKIGSI